jgi:hypothetical protein
MLLHGIDFTNEPDMLKAVANVANHIEDLREQLRLARAEEREKIMPYLKHIGDCGIGMETYGFSCTCGLTAIIQTETKTK